MFFSVNKLVSFVFIFFEICFHDNLYVFSYSPSSWDRYQQPIHKNQRLTNNSTNYQRGRRLHNDVLTIDKSNEFHRLRYVKNNSNQNNSPLMLKHIQTGSVPYKNYDESKIDVSPDHNKTESYIVKLNSNSDSVNLMNGKENHNHRRSHLRRRHNKNNYPNYQRIINDPGKLCIKCPPERTVVAQKYLDGAVIDLPNVSTCRNQQLPKHQYVLETLFGDSYNYVLPQGEHTFIGRILNKKTNLYEHTCVLKYKVIVKQCGKYFPRNRFLKAKCDMNGIWGSKCSFSCVNEGSLSHLNSVECGDEMQWIGEEPSCIFSDDYSLDSEMPNYKSLNKPSRNSLRIKTKTSKNCDIPFPPENGKFSCETQNDSINTNDLHISNGSLCRIKCNENYAIPEHLYNYSIFQCNGGKWNSTVVNSVCRQT